MDDLNGLLGLIDNHYQTLFEIFHSIGTLNASEVIKKVLCLSQSSFALVANPEFRWAVENVSLLRLTRYNMRSIYSRNRNSIFNHTGISTFLVDIILKGVTQLVYRVCHVGDEFVLSSLRIGCVIPKYNPYPANSWLGNSGEGQACYYAAHDLVFVFYNSSRVSLPPSLNLDKVEGKCVGVEVDLGGVNAGMEGKDKENKNAVVEKKREGKRRLLKEERTMIFFLEGAVLPFYFSGIPQELFFALQLRDSVSVEFVSLSRLRGSSAFRQNITKEMELSWQ